MRDYYEVLGVAHTASPSQIKKAFHKAAAEANPVLEADGPEAEARFAEIVESYEILSNPVQRQYYDRYYYSEYGADGYFMPPYGSSHQVPPSYPRRSWDMEIARWRRGSVPWSAWDVLAIVGLNIFAFIVMGVFIGLVVGLASVFESAGDNQEFFTSPLVNSLSWVLQWCLTLGVTFTYLKLRGYRFNLNVLGFRKTAPGHAALLIAGVLIGSFIVQGIYVQYVLPEQEEVTSLFGTSALSFILAMVIVAIFTPVLEELFFRGIIHQGLEQRFGFLPAALMSSFIFMLAHVDYTVYIPIFVLGFGFAALMSQTKSLWPSIIAHFLWNSLGVVAQFFSSGS